MESNFLKDKLREIKNLSEKVTRSDLQGIIMAEAISMNKDKQDEIENIFLLYCDNELNINEAKRFLLDLVDIGKIEKIETGGKKMKIEKSDFKDSEFFTAEDKYRTAKHFQRFVKNGFQRKDFVNRVYEHLHLHCGFIAHYDIGGFYHEYFNSSKEDLNQFISHFLNLEKVMPYEDVYNYVNIRMGDYKDINKVMADILIEFDIKNRCKNETID